jgi:hypothetical protein
MSGPFALGKIIDVIYEIDQNKDEEDRKRDFESNLKRLCLGLTAIFVVGGACNFGRVYLVRIAAQNITARLRCVVRGLAWLLLLLPPPRLYNLNLIGKRMTRPV